MQELETELMEDEAKASMTDELLDDLLPESLDWRGLVCSYPLPALILSGLGGFFLGRRHDAAILDALSDFVADQVDKNVSALLGDDRA